MGEKRIKKQFWLTEKQAELLKEKAKVARLSEVSLIRMLIDGYQPSAAPSREFFEHMNLLARQVDKLERISQRERDPEIRKMLYDESRYLIQFRLALVNRYLEGDKEKIIWW